MSEQPRQRVHGGLRCNGGKPMVKSRFIHLF